MLQNTVRACVCCMLIISAQACAPADDPRRRDAPVSVVGPHETYARGARTPVRGKQCEFGADDCNRCVNNVQAQIDLFETHYRENRRIRFAGYAYPHPNQGWLLERFSEGEHEHVQGIGRLAGVGNDEYMVFTHSTASEESNKQGALAVVRMGADQDTGGFRFDNMPRSAGSNVAVDNRTISAAFAGNNHPGGLSVLGKKVFVAQWCQTHETYGWCNTPSAKRLGFSVYDVANVAADSKSPPVEIAYESVVGHSWIGATSTAGVAATRLVDDTYLVALSDEGGKEYGFYTAALPEGRYVFRNASTIRHHGENGNFVTECGTGVFICFSSTACLRVKIGSTSSAW